MKTMQQVAIDICYKTLKIDENDFFEESGHQFTPFDIMIDSTEYYSYHEISISLVKMSYKLKDFDTFVIDIARRKENNSNYRWVRLCREIVKIYQNGGSGKLSLSNTFAEARTNEQSSKESSTFNSMFNDIFGTGFMK